MVAACAYGSDGARPAPRGRLGRRQGVHVHELRARRRAPGVRELRAARPQGRVHVPRDRARRTGPCCRTSRRPSPSPPTAAPRDLALPGHPAALDLPDRASRPASTTSCATRTPPPRGQVIPLELACRASLAAHLEPERHVRDHQAGPRLLHHACSTATSRSPSTTRSSCPSSAPARWRTRACVTFTEQLLFRSKVTDAMYELRAIVILHEMAHMWFGDLVTMQWWDDLWLNESFAEFCGTLATAEATRFTDAWTTFANGRKTWGYLQDQLPSTHPIAADVPTLSRGRSRTSTGSATPRAPRCSRQLVAYVGREQFFAGMRAYFAEHAWGNATLADLLAALEASSGKDLADWSKAWLETAGPNTLRREFEVDAGRRVHLVRGRCRGPRPSTRTLRPHHIAIGLYNRVRRRAGAHPPGGGGHGRRRAPRCRSWSAPQQPDLVLLNDDDLTYALIRFDDAVAGDADRVDRRLRRLAGPRGVLERGDRHGAQAGCRCRRSSGCWSGGMAKETSISVLQILHSVDRRSCCAVAPTRRGCRRARRAGRRGAAAAARGRAGQRPPAGLGAAARLDRGHAGAARPARRAAGRQRDGAGPGRGHGAALGAAAPAGRHRPGRRRRDRRRAGAATPPTQGRGTRAACRAAIPDAEHKAAAWRLLAETEDSASEGVRRGRRGLRPARARRAARAVRGAVLRGPAGDLGERGEQMRVLLARCSSRTRRPRRSCSRGSTRSWPPRSATPPWPGAHRVPRRRASGRCGRGPCLAGRACGLGRRGQPRAAHPQPPERPRAPARPHPDRHGGRDQRGQGQPQLLGGDVVERDPEPGRIDGAAEQAGRAEQVRDRRELT